jgi:restriction system protein
MKSYYRVMAGRASAHAAECLAGGYIGADFGIREDLRGKLPEEWRQFNQAFIPVFQANAPGKSKISAGLACGALWTIAKGIKVGDVIMTPDGEGSYMVGEVVGEYEYVPGQSLPHRRKVRWADVRIARGDMSDALRHSTGSIGTVCNITDYHEELVRLIGIPSAPAVIATHAEIEDPLEFAMEKHLEDFLVANWAQTMLAAEWAIYEEDGERIGQQYATDAGTIDILARSKDGNRLLVVELKRGRATDVVVGQVLRYMGYVQEQVAESNQTVEGVVIALQDDQKLRWALSSVPSVRFLRYQVSFKLYAPTTEH